MTIRFHLKNPKDSSGALRRDECSIVAKITLTASERFEIPTGLWIAPKYWDFVAQRVKANDSHPINLELSALKIKWAELWRTKAGNFSEFKATIKGTAPKEKKTLPDALEKFLSQYQVEKDVKTHRIYKTMKSHLEAYRLADFPEIDFNYYDGLKAYLYSKDLIDSTVYKIIGRFTTFLRWAQQRGYPVLPVFENWQIIKRVTKPISLTLEELKKLENAILPKSLSIARDYFCLECRTGQRISDLQRFDAKDFNNGVWTFYQRKGNRLSANQVIVPFTGYIAPALQILERHKFKLPKVAEQTINENLKLACKKAKINSKVTDEYWQGGARHTDTYEKWELVSTHMGRKTFVTVGQQFMSAKAVKQIAGIRSWQTFKHYDADVQLAALKSDLEQGEKLKNLG